MAWNLVWNRSRVLVGSWWALLMCEPKRKQFAFPPNEKTIFIWPTIILQMKEWNRKAKQKILLENKNSWISLGLYVSKNIQ